MAMPIANRANPVDDGQKDRYDEYLFGINL